MKRFYLLNLYLIFLAVCSHAQTTLEFVKNNGQWDGDFLYRSITGTGDIYLQKNAISYVLGEQGAQEKIDAFRHAQIKNPPTIRHHAYRMIFENSLNPSIVEKRIQKHYYNYFLGNDSSRWKSGIHPALTLDYEGLYDGIDMHLYSEGQNLKYDFIVAPYKDPSQISLKFEGANKVSVAKNGSLIVATSVGDVTELKPVVYQYVGEERVTIPCNYTVHNNTVGFEFSKDYNHALPLVIDPTVVFCTFSGSTADNWGFTATYDAAGNMYTGGFASDEAGGSFPVTTGAFQTTYGGGTKTTGSQVRCDMAIMKISSDGTTKIYATYLGGSDNDQPHSMVVDAANNLVIAGRTYSANYPTTTTAFDRTYNGGGDLVITKLNATGTALIGSTFVGGSLDDCVNYTAIEFDGGNLKHNYGDDARSEVILDDAGNVYVASCTFSPDFPTQDPIQAALAGGQDAVLLKMNNNLSTMLFSTYYGGTNDDAGYVLVLNKAQDAIFMGGGTMSTDFPTTPGTYRPAFIGGTTDGYIVKVSNGPYALQRATHIGAAAYDQVYGVAIDNNDDLYMMGQTLGGGFPVTAGVYNNPGSSQFIMKMDNNLNSPIYSTVYGSGTSSLTNISPVAFLVDTCQNVYISGWGGTLGGASFPFAGTTTGMPITPATAIQTATDGYDFYFIVLGKNATTLLYGSFFGRSSPNSGLGEHVDGGTSRFDKNGIVYQAICGGCGGPGGPTFPTTPGSLSPTNASRNCNLAALKISFDLGAVKAEASASPDAKGCAPFTVNFKNASTNARTYSWDFVDGTGGSTAKEPTHTFYKPGTYKVRMVAYNPDACIEYDTSYVSISVDTNSIVADFEFMVIDSCRQPYQVSFNNTSTFGKSGTATFTWDFGDGNKYAGQYPPVHGYTKTGTFIVTLIMDDPLSCNNPDTMKKTFSITPKFLKAETNLPDVICSRVGGVYFANLATNATSVLWDFGDGKTSSDFAPTHKFDTGTFTVTMIVFSTNACNKTDTFRKKISIKPGATAAFDFAPKIPQSNDSIHYTNQSFNALTYLWSFGDGGLSKAEHPSHLFSKTGTYKTCLIAGGFENCNDTLCKDVEALIVPLIDVPTAFTPNGDGINDILYVRGAAIETMDFSIYNRWGQLVFHSNNTEIGWNGTYNGKPQPMESYAYVLNATFINGETETKRGNITILE